VETNDKRLSCSKTKLYVSNYDNTIRLCIVIPRKEVRNMKEILQNKFTIPLVLLAVVGVTGSVFTLKNSGPLTANAQSATVQKADVAENAADKPDTGTQVSENQKSNVISSVKTQETTETTDTTEAQKLASLAKISSDQAKVTAEKSANGTASSVKLENENGNVVYVVTVGTKEVKVDAGNGTILKTESADTAESENTSE
jgi:uncharacterized membrane protein YkoI